MGTPNELLHAMSDLAGYEMHDGATHSAAPFGQSSLSHLLPAPSQCLLVPGGAPHVQRVARACQLVDHLHLLERVVMTPTSTRESLPSLAHRATGDCSSLPCGIRLPLSSATGHPPSTGSGLRPASGSGHQRLGIRRRAPAAGHPLPGTRLPLASKPCLPSMPRLQHASAFSWH